MATRTFINPFIKPPIEGEENQFTKRKTESYVFNGFGNSVSCDLPQADFGRLPENLSVRPSSINKNFVN